MVDRRKMPRYKLNCSDNYFYHADSVLMGVIVNISEAGLGFEYASIDKLTAAKMTFDILAPKAAVTKLVNMECIKIYDIVRLEERRSFRGTSLRQSGVSFVGLNKRQLSDILKLKDFDAALAIQGCNSTNIK